MICGAYKYPFSAELSDTGRYELCSRPIQLLGGFEVPPKTFSPKAWEKPHGPGQASIPVLVVGFPALSLPIASWGARSLYEHHLETSPSPALGWLRSAERPNNQTLPSLLSLGLNH